jgi:hypothetical protein
MGAKQKKNVKGTVATAAATSAPSPASHPIVPSPVANAQSEGASGAATPHLP